MKLKVLGFLVRSQQNYTRFCTYCKESGHTIGHCNKKKSNTQSFKPRQNSTNTNANTSRSYNNTTPPPQNSQKNIPENPGLLISPGGTVTKYQPEYYSSMQYRGPPGGSPHARTKWEKSIFRDPTRWGYHYEPWPRNTNNPLINNASFRHRRDSGWGPPPKPAYVNWQEQLWGTRKPRFVSPSEYPPKQVIHRNTYGMYGRRFINNPYTGRRPWEQNTPYTPPYGMPEYSSRKPPPYQQKTNNNQQYKPNIPQQNQVNQLTQSDCEYSDEDQTVNVLTIDDRYLN